MLSPLTRGAETVTHLAYWHHVGGSYSTIWLQETGLTLEQQT